MGPTVYDSDHVISTKVEAASGALPTDAEPSVYEGSGSAVEPGGASSSGAANSARTSEWPTCDCTNCRTRVSEALTIRARVRLLDAALAYPEMHGLIFHHSRALVAMLRERGWA